MSNYNFTNAAHAEASRRFPSGAPASSRFNAEQKTGRAGFIGGAEWARDHLAAQEPTDAEVEAAGRVILACIWNGSEEDAPQAVIAYAWDQARAALSDAREARHDVP